MCGDPIVEFIGLRPKLYSILGKEEYECIQNCYKKDDA